MSLAQVIPCHSDNLSRTLQKTNLSAAEGQAVMTVTVTTFRSLRSDSNYKLFWVKVTATAAQLGVHEAQFPHCRKAPKRYEQGGMDSHHFPTTVEEQIYFEAIDNICTS